jgi:hypothetical protein
VNKSGRLRWPGYLARKEKDMSAFKVLVGKPVGKRPLRRPRLRWEDNNVSYRNRYQYGELS